MKFSNYLKSLMAIVLLLTVSNVSAEGSMHNHQKEMEKTISEMDVIIKSVEQEENAWKLRSGMQQHAVLMDRSVELLDEMMEETRKENSSCLKNESQKADSESCYEVESHEELQARMMLILIQHLINRQNVILEKIGIVN